jgi:hypothetical protein
MCSEVHGPLHVQAVCVAMYSPCIWPCAVTAYPRLCYYRVHEHKRRRTRVNATSTVLSLLACAVLAVDVRVFAILHDSHAVQCIVYHVLHVRVHLCGRVSTPSPPLSAACHGHGHSWPNAACCWPRSATACQDFLLLAKAQRSSQYDVGHTEVVPFTSTQRCTCCLCCSACC